MGLLCYNTCEHLAALFLGSEIEQEFEEYFDMDWYFWVIAFGF